jgi:ubiquitin carboxyl-terminal hydrolase 10
MFQRIMFQREFSVIASAENAESFRKRLKNDELERYGDPFSPDYIYDAIKKLPRFASMTVSTHLTTVKPLRHN